MLEIPKLPIQAASPALGVNANSPTPQNRTTASTAPPSSQGASGNKAEKTSIHTPTVKDETPGSQAKESFARALERQLAHAEVQAKRVTGLALASEHCASKLLGEMGELSPLVANITEQHQAEEEMVIPDNLSLSGLLPLPPQPPPASLSPCNEETIATARTKPIYLADQPESTSDSGLPHNILPLPVTKDEKPTLSAEVAGISELSTPAAHQTAEFAAPTSEIDNILPYQNRQVEPTKSETSFESMLATVQASHLQRSNEPPATTRPSPPVLMNTPLNQAGWNNEIADKLVWMVGRQEQRAELVINPPQFGRIEITLSISNDQTTALFFSANPAVRETLESALPHLRDILADSGITLGQAQVGAESQQNKAQQPPNNRENRDNSSYVATSEDLTRAPSLLEQIGTAQWRRQGSALVDVFA